MPQPLSHIIDQLKREPSRTGSLIITVFGDAIVPRGGTVWLGTLLEFFAGLDIDGNVVRTAMSRLTAEGWFERGKVGRNSFYRLVKQGQQSFAAATRHIYDPPPTEWTGSFELLLISGADQREAARDALKNAGFGSPLPGVFVAPAGTVVPEEAREALRLDASAAPDMARRLLAESWTLDRTAEAYLKFIATFTPLQICLHKQQALSEGDAFTARILLIHHYRRIVLRDPLLPAELLPKDWPGGRARRLCGEIYRALLPGSERWLDRHATDENGPLPPAGEVLVRRFGDG
ncbi:MULTISPECIES: phenylacetic acid degradation operon negative regulatory protein PaaX [unclassified Bradyrhizobium]|uniref:phenylacetic acid degradation operon negative regulatory protein PaaX n=1 Tax=unclassified Bradyrhizobium TaxID=2631580 RepID=UPI0029161D48|nr:MULTISPECIES: phenylacetic acid degradation operon negative regulatory protein PaaX [unclassified Bradyrhizobium]